MLKQILAFKQTVNFGKNPVHDKKINNEINVFFIRIDNNLLEFSFHRLSNKSLSQSIRSELTDRERESRIVGLPARKPDPELMITVFTTLHFPHENQIL